MLTKLLHRTLLALLLFTTAPALHSASVDRIVAVVNDDVILASELTLQGAAIKKRLKESNTPLPTDDIIARQMLERMIVDKLQQQLAERSGITIDDQTIQQSAEQIAKRNNMSHDQFVQALHGQGITYPEFLEQMRSELLISRLRQQFVISKVKVSDREVEHFMETQGAMSYNQNLSFHVGHILIATPTAASPDELAQARRRTRQVLDRLDKGADFRETAIRFSDGPQALKGGDLGWRSVGQLPGLIAEAVINMHEGEVVGPLRSPSGFHVVKLLEMKGATGKHLITETDVRHILLKTSQLFNDDDAKKQLLKLKKKIENGGNFAKLARANSDDSASALKDGKLGWMPPGALVPPFEKAMNALSVNEVSEPVQSQFGWHLIQVLGRRERDDTSKHNKDQARTVLRQRKVEEAGEVWIRRLRDEAYVDIRL